MSPTVDVHTHVVPRSLPTGAGRDAAWPAVELNDDGSGVLEIGGSVFRQLAPSAWNVDARLEDMDVSGIDVQWLSPLPELLSPWFGADDGEVLCRSVNGSIAAMVDQRPDRFRGLGMVPVQDPARAAAMVPELADAGFIGIEIPTHVNDVPLSHPDLDTVFAAAAAHDLMVMVHPLRPAGVAHAGGPSVLAAATALPLDTALAAVALIGGGTLDRHPELRVLLCHGGGALPFLLPRLDCLHEQVPGLRAQLDRAPTDHLSSFWFDTAVYDPRTLAHLVEIVGAERVVVGTDYPFVARQDAPLDLVAAAVDPAQADAIATTNPQTLCGAHTCCGAA